MARKDFMHGIEAGRGVSYDELFDDYRQAIMAHRTDMTIDKGLTVKKGEETTLKNKNLIISTQIRISGCLTLENCRIDTKVAKFVKTIFWWNKSFTDSSLQVNKYTH